MHTPGPLTITGPSDRRLPYDYGGDYVIRAEDGRIIAETFHLTGEDATEDAQANAQLFATAHKLLDACEMLVEWYLEGMPMAADIAMTDGFMKAHTAIAEAKGEQ